MQWLHITCVMIWWRQEKLKWMRWGLVLTLYFGSDWRERERDFPSVSEEEWPQKEKKKTFKRTELEIEQRKEIYTNTQKHICVLYQRRCVCVYHKRKQIKKHSQHTRLTIDFFNVCFQFCKSFLNFSFSFLFSLCCFSFFLCNGFS
jgi:hypothetical protein